MAACAHPAKTGACACKCWRVLVRVLVLVGTIPSSLRRFQKACQPLLLLPLAHNRQLCLRGCLGSGLPHNAHEPWRLIPQDDCTHFILTHGLLLFALISLTIGNLPLMGQSALHLHPSLLALTHFQSS